MRDTKPVSPIFINRNKYDLYFWGLVSIMVIFILFILATVAFAETSYDNATSSKKSQEMATSLKNTRESRQSEGIKQSTSEKSGSRTDSREETKQSKDASKKQSTNISISLLDILKQALLVIEKDIYPFNKCRVLSNPLLPATLGLEGSIGDGAIDNTKLQYINNLASMNGKLGDIVSKDKLKLLDEYLNCVSFYSALLSQATFILLTDIEDLNIGKVSKDKSTVFVGMKDLYILADGAIIRAYNAIQHDGNLDPALRRVYDSLSTFLSNIKLHDCRFVGSIGDFNCGVINISVTPNPILLYGDMEIYGKSIMGMTIKTTLDVSNSIVDGFSKAASKSKYSDWVKDVQKYTDSLESQGKSKEAIQAFKTATEIMNSNKMTVKMDALLKDKK